MSEMMENMVALTQLEVIKVQTNRASLDKRIVSKKLKVRELELEIETLNNEIEKMSNATDEDLDEVYEAVVKKIKELRERR